MFSVRSVNDSLEIQNPTAELRPLAERKAGTMLSQMGLQGGDRKSNSYDDRVKLSDVGVTQKPVQTLAASSHHLRSYLFSRLKLGLAKSGIFVLFCRSWTEPESLSFSIVRSTSPCSTR